MTGPAVRSTLFHIAFLLAAVAPRAEAQRGWADLARRFDAFAEAAGVVGGSALLVRKGEVVARHHFGFADRATKRRVGDRTIYHWASVTKTLTAVAVLQLRDRGRLTLDDRITRWVPELREVHDPGGAVDSITVAMLLSHSSGLQTPTWPWSRGESWEPFEPTTWAQLVAMMPYQRLHFRSYVGATPYHLAADRSHGYRRQGDSLTDGGADFDPGITIPNGGWNAPVEDVARYLGFLTGFPADSASRARHAGVLSRRTLEEMW
nr:beta-lactamase family protein [Gemmatimonadales bacterium]